MRYAYVGADRVEPFKGLRGICPCCGGEVIAKCGQFKIHHWAHKNLADCDPWWENESEWHRQWKSYFPPDRQEVVLKDPSTEERHIADVLSEKGVILEFQSYSIDPEEMAARENFYKQMIWVVNGSKSEFDRVYFNMSVHGAHTSDNSLRNLSWIGRGKLLAKWSLSARHVYLDFGSDVVWHLLSYDIKAKKGQVRAYQKQKFIEFFGGVFRANKQS